MTFAVSASIMFIFQKNAGKRRKGNKPIITRICLLSFCFWVLRPPLFLNQLFCPFSLLFAAHWSWKLPFQLYHITIFPTFWNSNRSFSIVFATLWCSNFYIAWYFATRVHLRLVYSCCKVYLGLILGFI